MKVDGERSVRSHHPEVAIALGGGGARGIAHVLALEALDELGVRPAAIAGTSMGAVIGAAYAAGLEARAIRGHVLRVLRNRSDVMGKLLKARVGRFADLVLRGRGNPVLLDPEIFLDLFWPPGVPEQFEGLAIKTFVVATNYSDRSEIVYRSGRLKPAVAGSMAIPGTLSSSRKRQQCSYRWWSGESAAVRFVIRQRRHCHRNQCYVWGAVTGAKNSFAP